MGKSESYRVWMLREIIGEMLPLGLTGRVMFQEKMKFFVFIFF